MNAQDIAGYLADLGQELTRQGIQPPFRVLMVGGAYMLTQVGNRPATRDIDVVLEDIPDSSISPLYQPFLAAVRAVADALRNYGPIPPSTVWRTYGPLEVRIPGAAYMLALKVLGGRPGDVLDARELCARLGLTTRTEARHIVDTYITDDQIKQAQGVDTTLTQLFP